MIRIVLIALTLTLLGTDAFASDTVPDSWMQVRFRLKPAKHLRLTFQPQFRTRHQTRQHFRSYFVDIEGTYKPWDWLQLGALFRTGRKNPLDPEKIERFAPRIQLGWDIWSVNAEYRFAFQKDRSLEMDNRRLEKRQLQRHKFSISGKLSKRLELGSGVEFFRLNQENGIAVKAHSATRYSVSTTWSLRKKVSLQLGFAYDDKRDYTTDTDSKPASDRFISKLALRFNI